MISDEERKKRAAWKKKFVLWPTRCVTIENTHDCIVWLEDVYYKEEWLSFRSGGSWDKTYITPEQHARLIPTE